MDSNRKGAVAEAEIAAAATRLGIPVLRPLAEHGRYDLGFEIAGRLFRVQCKWGSIDHASSVIKVSLRSSWCTPTGYERRSYGRGEIDLLAVCRGQLDRSYLVPGELAVERAGIWLRLTPPLNSQRACVNLASNFEFDGAVAQLEERRAGSAQARGSSPLSSTTPSGLKAPVWIGSNEFRNRFGHYLERAAAGDEIHISRHHKPFARLLPAEEPSKPELSLVTPA
jgi:prevent-host-death family protein